MVNGIYPPIGTKMMLEPGFWECATNKDSGVTPKAVEATVIEHNEAHGWYRVEYRLGDTVQHEVLYAKHRPDEGARIYEPWEQKLKKAAPPVADIRETLKPSFAPRPVLVTDPETGEVARYSSGRDAAKALGVRQQSMRNGLKYGYKVNGCLVAYET